MTSGRATAIALVLLLVGAAACSGTESSPDGSTGAVTRVPATAPGPPTTARRTPTSIAAPPVNSCSSPKPFPPTNDPQTMTSGGATRTYLLSVPPDYNGTTGTPVILDFHGFTLTKEIQSALSGLPAQGAAKGMIVVTPDAIGSLRSWNMFRRPGEPDDFAFVDDLLTELETRLCVDPNRIFATGISNGSAFSALLACTAPYRVAAIGMVSATIGPTCPPEVTVPVIAFHGTSDPVVPYRGGRVNSPAALGNDAPPAEQAIKEWAVHDGCHEVADEQRPKPSVRRLDYPDCSPGNNVTLYALQGGGHTWPGGLNVEQLGIRTFGATNLDVAASDLMIDFFRSHPKHA